MRREAALSSPPSPSCAARSPCSTRIARQPLSCEHARIIIPHSRSRQCGQGRQAGSNIPDGLLGLRRNAAIGDARAQLPREPRGVSQTRFCGSAQSIGHRVHLTPIEDLRRALQAVSLAGPHHPGNAELMGPACSLTLELASGSRPPSVPKAMPPARTSCEQPAAATPRADHRHRRSMGCAQRRPASRQRRDRPLALKLAGVGRSSGRPRTLTLPVMMRECETKTADRLHM